MVDLKLEHDTKMKRELGWKDIKTKLLKEISGQKAILILELMLDKFWSRERGTRCRYGYASRNNTAGYC